MNSIQRCMTTIGSDDLKASSDFYTALFDFEVQYTSDWFVHLVSKNPSLELGIIDRKNALLPSEFQLVPNGFYITFVVDNADAMYELAQSLSLEILAAPGDTF